MITVLIVDDQPAVLRGLRMRLEMESDIRVVGEASSGELAIERAAELQPHVVVMDVVMPGIGGIAATRHIVRATRSAVVVMSLHDDARTCTDAIAAGGAAFVSKHEADALLTTAIRSAAASVETEGSPRPNNPNSSEEQTE